MPVSAEDAHKLSLTDRAKLYKGDLLNALNDAPASDLSTAIMSMLDFILAEMTVIRNNYETGSICHYVGYP